MRDPKRIRKYCDQLAAMWERVPDWRFGQLMCNLLGAAGKDPFFPEDQELFAAMEAAMNQMLGAPDEVVNNHIEGVLREENHAG